MHETALPAPPSSISTPRPAGSGAVEEAVAIWDALAALGVRDAVLAPGSRSAPLVYGLCEPRPAAEIRSHVRIDERAAAFTALGLSRHDRAHPAVVATTSGTATAHLLAAVMESHHSRVPLLVLTADRPAELRDVGANQTTRQAGMFRSLVRFDADLPAPTATGATPAELRTAVSVAARAFAVATGEHPGPVHLNLGFRDPLVPRAPAADIPAGERERIVLTHRPAPVPPPAHPVPVSARTVVVAGDAGAAARGFAERHHLPLLAEPSSGARGGATLVPGYPALLAEIMADPDHPLRPERAIVFGHPTLSRPVIGQLLGAEDVEVIVVDQHPDWADAARRARLVVPAAAGEDPALADSIRSGAGTGDGAGAGTGAGTGEDEQQDRSENQQDRLEVAARQERLEAWRRAAADRTAQLTAAWQQRAALAVWNATGEDDLLVLGSSSLIRDLEQHAGATAGRIIANRGLAGIDGTLSMAGGIALALRGSGDVPGAGTEAGAAPGRVRVLAGDLTALHDLTGLVIGPHEQTPDLDVIVVDDGGGRIFSGLEHAAAPPELLRRFFTTPHGVDIAGAVTALGAAVQRVDADSLPAALAQSGSGLRAFLVQEGSSSQSSNSAAEVVP
ncbi:2-succinyl-5-enolpyruvyl-6-hydroxy-3-cyclohexene-1-carboxylic-acid synthase [Brachybacterium sp. GCM10030267]|uniref:2-succinyl-5-enolpyruvyl-6-hydroxy-3- cyclohexene-1-carboxylic-acid synthase n=1 Tax=Brachybacterium sp. GCM10030267 TaxID=3273381 RepID=UPI00360F8D05